LEGELVMRRLRGLGSAILGVTSIVVVVVPRAGAAGTVLRIDPAVSSFRVGSLTGQPCSSFDTSCTPEAGWVGGDFAAFVEPWGGSWETLRFEAIDIVTPPLVNGPFRFPAYRVLIDDGDFSGNGDPCNFWDSGGSCSSMGNFGGISGGFDGQTLTMDGAAPIDADHSYLFHIEAVAVPEPSSGWLLLGLECLFVGWTRHRGSGRGRRRRGVAQIRPSRIRGSESDPQVSPVSCDGRVSV